jgi:hypothetical protein
MAHLQGVRRITLFDEVRYGYFNSAFSGVLRAVQGCANEGSIMILLTCAISAFSNVEWALDNPGAFMDEDEKEEDKPPDRKGRLLCKGEVRTDVSVKTKEMFIAWCDRWVKDTGINPKCDSEKIYAVRCALEHTGGASNALWKAGFHTYWILWNTSKEHYVCRETQKNRFGFGVNLDDFIPELMLAADKFLNANQARLDEANDPVQLHIGFVAGRVNDSWSMRLADKNALNFVHPELATSPITLSKSQLTDAILRLRTNR